jgi:hypothetical protein
LREAQKVGRVRLAKIALGASDGRVAAERDEARLVRVQRQRERRRPLRSVGLMLEPGHGIIGREHDDHCRGWPRAVIVGAGIGETGRALHREQAKARSRVKVRIRVLTQFAGLA